VIASRLAIGTAQFGLPYGLSHGGEPVGHDEARRILEVAAAAGVTLLDTAPAYGDIECRLSRLCVGLPFSIISKISAFDGDPSAVSVRSWVQRSVELTLGRLERRLTGLLFHRVDDLLGPFGDVAWQAATDYCPSGVRIGVSVYSPDEAIVIRQRYPVELVQVPGNAFDQRLLKVGVTDALKGVEIHLRSAFLQGLLLGNVSTQSARVPGSTAVLSRWHAWCAERHLNYVEAALSIAKGFPGVAACVIGCDSAPQAREILAAWEKSKPTVEPELSVDDSVIIDPRNWVFA